MALSLGDRPLHGLSVDDVLGMVAAGMLGEDDRVDLLDEALVDMSPKSPEHTALLTVLMRWLARWWSPGSTTCASSSHWWCPEGSRCPSPTWPSWRAVPS